MQENPYEPPKVPSDQSPSTVRRRFSGGEYVFLAILVILATIAILEAIFVRFVHPILVE